MVRWCNRTCGRAVHVHKLDLMLPPEQALVGCVEVLDTSQPHSPASTLLQTGSVDCCDGEARTRPAVKVDEPGVEDTHAVVKRRDDALLCAVAVSQEELVDVAHDGAVGHRRSSFLSETRHGRLDDALGFDASLFVVDHEESVKLHSTHVHPLGAFLTVPGGERIKNRRLGDSGAATSVFHREVVDEDPKTEPALRVNGVVEELTQRNLLLADVVVEGRAVGVLVHAVPKPKVGSSSGGVVSDDVVGVGDPVRGGGDVVVEQTGALFDKHRQVVLQDVLRLDAVLDEEGASHDVIDDVVLDQQSVRVVDGDGPVEGLMDRAASNVGLVVDIAHQMPVDWVTTQSEGLTCMEDLRRHRTSWQK